MQTEVFTIHWNGFDIEVSFKPSHSKAFNKTYGYALSHIEIRTTEPAGAALPITNSGYRSIFIPKPELDAVGGAGAYVLDALDEAAKSKEWKILYEEQKQFSLF